MTLDEYLTSPAAIEEFNNWQQFGNPWIVEPDGAWQRAWHVLRPDLCVYYRRCEGERFIVSDLGNAMHVLRRRSGCLEMEACRRARSVLDSMNADACSRGDEIWIALCGGSINSETRSRGAVTASNLPAAVARVLLAVHRVANTEDKT